MPRISLCQLSLPDTSFPEDIELAGAVGAQGLGIDEMKLDGADVREQSKAMVDAGVKATICSANILTVLPLPNPRIGLYPGPNDPQSRLHEMVASVERLAHFQPECVFFVSGPPGEYEEPEARRLVVEALGTLGAVASANGTRIGLEPMRPSVRAEWSLITSIEECVGLLDDVGSDDVGIVFDTWHMWDAPGIHDLIPSILDRIVGVQVADYREPNRGPRDRLFPGDGVGDIQSLLRAFRAAGYDGWYDLEVFSDDGRFGYAYEDSLWKLGPDEFARQSVAAFLRTWDAAS